MIRRRSRHAAEGTSKGRFTRLRPTGPVESWSSLRLGLAGVAVMVVIVLAVMVISSINLSRKEVTAEFAQAAEVRSGDQVTLAGIPVGEVAGLELAGDRVLVRMKVDRDLHLGADTQASIKLTTLLGARYIAILPSERGSLEDNRIPLANTHVPYDLQDALGDATKTFEQVDAVEIAAAMTTLNEQLDGTPEIVPEAVANAGALAEIVAARRAQLGDLIRGTERITESIRTQRATIGSLMTRGNQLMTEVNTRRTAIAGMFEATTALIDQLKKIVVDDQPELQQLIDDLDSMLASIAANDDLLRNTLEVAPIPVRNFTNASGTGNYVSFIGPAGVLIDSWMCALSGRAEQIGAQPYFEDCR